MTAPSNIKIVMLAGGGVSTWILANAIRKTFGDLDLVVEGRLASTTVFRRRAKRIGAIRVAGQAMFHAYAATVGRSRSKARQQQIEAEYDLDATRWPTNSYHAIHSVNDPSTIEIIKRANPTVIVICGTRIIGRRLLEAAEVSVINMHAGITPRYRGVHGGYWALATDDGANCGVTVHLVDTGLDTGAVLAQRPMITPTADDSIFTYPLLQIAAGLPDLLEMIAKASANTLEPGPGIGPSKLWYHPTLGEYLRHGWARGVW